MGPGRISSEKTIENMGLFVRANSNPMVRYGEFGDVAVFDREDHQPIQGFGGFLPAGPGLDDIVGDGTDPSSFKRLLALAKVVLLQPGLQRDVAGDLGADRIGEIPGDALQILK